MELELEYAYVYEETLRSHESGKKIIIHKGGTGSGKTMEIMMFIIFYVAAQKPSQIITIVSESFPHLEIGTIRILNQFLLKTGLISMVDYNKSRNICTFPNNTIIEFFSADRIDKALGARRDWLYGNEINSLKFDVWDELARRSENVLADFNPTAQFWLEKYLEFSENYEVILSNYTNNPFLPDTERQKIIRRASMDPNFKRIHIDCEYGTYEGLIFTQFSTIDFFPEIESIYGLDFGYTNDPTALVRVGIINTNIYIDELIYRTGLTNSEIAALLESNGVRKRYDEIVADSSEPKSIDELNRSGFNVKPAQKGPDSIRQGIDLMKQYNIHITKRSVNLIREVRNYSWVMDKEGNATNKPIDTFNHGIDAARYAIQFKKSKKVITAPKWNF